MNTTKLMGLILGLLGVALLVGGLFIAISDLGAILNAMIEFVSANSGSLSKCGITMPAAITQLQGQVATVILPAVYLGIPLAVVLLSILMFGGGFYYGKGSLKEEVKKEQKQQEQFEQEVERRVSKKKRPAEEPEEAETQ